jgi:hypothetical protein
MIKTVIIESGPITGGIDAAIAPPAGLGLTNATFHFSGKHIRNSPINKHFTVYTRINRDCANKNVEYSSVFSAFLYGK